MSSLFSLIAVPMNKSDLTDRFAARAGIPKSHAQAHINTIFELMGEALAEGEKVVVSDFGTFTVSHRKGFQGQNPRTGEPIEVSARRIPVFKCGKALKRSLND